MFFVKALASTEVCKDFFDIVRLAALLRTIPCSQAISERTGRRLGDLEAPYRSSLLACGRSEKVFLLGGAGTPRQWSTQARRCAYSQLILGPVFKFPFGFRTKKRC